MTIFMQKNLKGKDKIGNKNYLIYKGLNYKLSSLSLYK